MNTNQAPQMSERHKQKGFAWQLGRIWHWLTEPAVTVQKPESRRRAQLLSSLLVILVPLPIIVFIARLFIDPAFSPSLIAVGGLIALLIVYGLSRTRHYKLAAGFIVSLFPIAIFTMVITAYNPADFRNLLSYLALGMILGSTLLSVRGTVILALIDIGCLLLLPTFIPEVTFTTIIPPLTFLSLLAGLIVVAMRHRNLIEMDRQLELRASNCRLEYEIDERTRAELALRRSEENLRATLNSIGDAVIATDAKGAIAGMNPVAEKLTGWTFEESRGKALTEVFNIVNSQTRETTVNPVNKALENGEIVGLGNHTMLIVKDGTAYQIADSASPIRDSNGNITGVVLVFRDVSEEYRVREALRESERDLLEAQHIAHIGNWSHNLVTGEIKWSDEMFRIIGCERRKVTLEWLTSIIYPEDMPRLQEAWEATQAGQRNIDLDIRLVRSDGEVRNIQNRWESSFDDAGKEIKRVGTIQDITERKQAEAELRESEEKWRSLTENSPNHIMMLDTDYTIRFINHTVPDLTKEQVIGKSNFDFVPSGYRQVALDCFERVIRNGKPDRYETKYITIEGETQYFDVRISSLTDKGGNITGFISTSNDITERAQAEESLRQLNQAIEQSPVSVIITDTEGIIQYVNPKFTQVTGYSAAEAIGQNPRILQSGEHLPAFYRELWETITAGGEWRNEFHNKKKNGELYWETASITGVKNHSGKITHYVAVKEDITQRKQLEEETVRQERLAVVGQLAAGIAHDFNNILTSIIGFADLLQRRPNVPKDVHRDLTRIIEQGQRAAKLIRQILDFSRQTVNEPRPLELRVYLNETLQFIERTIPESIQIQFNFERGDYIINADPAQLQQVITNLAVNARDAMPDGGALYLDLSRISFAPDEPPPCPDMEGGEWIRLAVTDTGSGIAPEALPHIFEPFFTTKEVGQGTGLGLAQIYGIVKQHNGCITVNSQIEQGATFTLYFPALVTQATAKSEADEALPMGQGETILLVEDEQIVREVAQAMLKMLDYRVLTAKDGVEALAVYRAQADQIALVLTDAVMPRMDGFALALVLQAEAPGVTVLLMSGYARDSEIAPRIRQNITARLQKPLNFHQLAQALRKALG